MRRRESGPLPFWAIVGAITCVCRPESVELSRGDWLQRCARRSGGSPCPRAPCEVVPPLRFGVVLSTAAYPSHRSEFDALSVLVIGNSESVSPSGSRSLLPTSNGKSNVTVER